MTGGGPAAHNKPFTKPFTKVEAVGNDFVLVDEATGWGSGAATDWPALAVRLCDRRFGVGGDGLLVLSGPSAVADLRMRMFNPDGTEDMCGNGLRCAILAARQRGRISDAAEGTVETIAGLRRFQIHADESITTEMGAPRFAPAALPMNVPGAASNDSSVFDYALPLGKGRSLPVSVVSTGTTHTVVWTKQLPDDETFLDLSPQIENHPFFPERTSVLWTVAEPPGTLRLRIWERGAGETLGCGTGACAAAVLARVQHKLPNEPAQVAVVSRGGTLHVSWAGGKEDVVLLSGRAEAVYEGNVAL